ncbi:methionine synthase [Acidipropionibacterium jensenii]|uniref:Methionine synthase n=2 Tax=Acidipropionibacterium jensenii TaxID=1749 RepID=A0A3Q9UKE2_9ACTN|nr:methionine synthase [Acidipropionibacterium jensenii]AZZ39521.1 methionine synthase [Acidipropionibacterium jensenii]
MRATALGSLTGRDFRGALASMAEYFPDLIPLPELPDRGPGAGILGRGTALLESIPTDLGPAGWRLADADDRAARSARAGWRRDLDDLEETLAGESATVKIGICGPLTLAAGVHLRHGEAVLDDPGALRDVGQSLADGLAAQQAELSRRMPAVDWVWQLDEPAAPAVLAGRVATQSGLHRYPAMAPHTATGLIGPVVNALRTAGAARAALHCCAPGLSWDLLERIDIDDLLVDRDALGHQDLDHCAEWLESVPRTGSAEPGEYRRLGLGLVPTSAPDRVISADQILDRLVEVSRRIGVDRRLVLSGCILTPACGLASWSQPSAARQCEQLARAAQLAEEALRD